MDGGDFFEIFGEKFWRNKNVLTLRSDIQEKRRLNENNAIQNDIWLIIN